MLVMRLLLALEKGEEGRITPIGDAQQIVETLRIEIATLGIGKLAHSRIAGLGQEPRGPHQSLVSDLFAELRASPQARASSASDSPTRWSGWASARAAAVSGANLVVSYFAKRGFENIERIIKR